MGHLQPVSSVSAISNLLDSSLSSLSGLRLSSWSVLSL